MPRRLMPLASLLLLALESAHALQIVEPVDGETVIARISRKELTRIAVEDGRVRRLFGNSGEFVLEKDEERGEVYLRPTSPNTTKPINVFVSTGRISVSLLLEPVDTPAEAIVIREPKSSTPAPSALRAQTHVRQLKHLALAMAEGSPIEGFESKRVAQLAPALDALRVLIESRWTGAVLVGERLELRNTSKEGRNLSERSFARPGVMAIAFDPDTDLNAVGEVHLAPGERLRLTVIRERRAHD